MHLVISIFIGVFTVVVLLAAVVFVIMEAQDRVDVLKERIPWLGRIIEKRESFNVLFLTCIVMMLGYSYEMVTKEIPEVPEAPVVIIKAPPAPQVQAEQPQPSSPPSESRAKNQPAPMLAHIRIADQKQVVSTLSDFPYAWQVVLQTDQEIAPVAFELICDGNVGRGEANFNGGAVFTQSKSGGMDNAPNTFGFEWATPAFTPNNPIIVTLWSKSPLKVLSIQKIDYQWP